MKSWLIWLGLAAASLAHAHPLGNNTVNRQAGLQLSRSAITLDYRVDIAEIPTLLATTDADTDGDGLTSSAEWASYAHAYAERIRQGITLSADGAPLGLHLDSARAVLVPGAADLNTLRISTRFSAALPPHTGMKLSYQDQREPEQPGWKEVYFRAVKPLGVRTSDVPEASRSRDLTVYPAGELQNVLAATIEMGAVPSEQPLPPLPQNRATSDTRLPLAVPPAPPAVVKSVPLDPPPTPLLVVSPPRPSAMPPIPAPPKPAQAMPGTPSSSSSTPRTLPAWAFFRLGVHHIAIGWDHLMFLFGLVLAQFMLRPSGPAQSMLRPTKTAQTHPTPQVSRSRLRALVGVVTAFTLAHSLTLGLAASGLVRLPGAWVESAIALTIAYVGLMNLLGRNRHSTLLAFAFGLVHGFGFAGALAASMGSLRTQSSGWLYNLLAFNLGIEAFQLVLVLLMVPVLGWIAQHRWSDAALKIFSFIVLVAGLGWFFSRI